MKPKAKFHYLENFHFSEWSIYILANNCLHADAIYFSLYMAILYKATEKRIVYVIVHTAEHDHYFAPNLLSSFGLYITNVQRIALM